MSGSFNQNLSVFIGRKKNDLYNKDGHIVLRHNTDAALILVKCN